MADKIKRNPKAPRQEPPRLATEDRLDGCPEVTLGFTPEQMRVEALRCLNCKNPTCIAACPVHVDIRSFIAALANGNTENAFEDIFAHSPFPGICGRVCQHELYCERACLLGKKLAPVAIGALERYVADAHAKNAKAMPEIIASSDKPRIACVGSGPASLMCAYALTKKGYRVTVYEALHRLGGVLAYGIPPFRLPRNVLETEIMGLKAMGVSFETNIVVGKTLSLEELFQDGFKAVFVGTGAGLPHFMGIAGENLVGVYTANEFLTRINLMEAYCPDAATPVIVGSHTLVIGGGNSAMDAARWACRLGSETTIVYRRGRAELPARLEEIDRAEEEGVRFQFLACPVQLFGNEAGMVREAECIRMALGEADATGRRSPVAVANTEFRLAAETVVVATGQSPNPTLQRATPGLATAKGGKIAVDENGATNIPLVFAGGDVARGGSTVIQAICDGKRAAESIDAALREVSE